MLSKKYRLGAKYLTRIYKEGRKFRGEYGMLVVKPLDINNPQFAFVVSKKVGNSVERHRMTRLLRQITQESIKELNIDEHKLGCQYIAFKYEDKYEELRKEYREQIKKAFDIT